MTVALFGGLAYGGVTGDTSVFAAIAIADGVAIVGFAVLAPNEW